MGGRELGRLLGDVSLVAHSGQAHVPGEYYHRLRLDRPRKVATAREYDSSRSPVRSHRETMRTSSPRVTVARHR